LPEVFLPGGEAVGEILAVVRQDRADADRASRLQAFKEIQSTLFALVVAGMREDPSTVGAAVGANMQLHPEMPLIPLLGQAHLCLPAFRSTAETRKGDKRAYFPQPFLQELQDSQQ
jgi:hypothetical protein